MAAKGDQMADDDAATVKLPADLVADLDRWIAEQREPKPSLEDAARYLLADTLIGLGIRKLR